MSSSAAGPLATYPGLISSSSAPGPAAAPAPATPWWNPAGLPGWAIALIVIIAILLLGGIGFAMSKST